jgi:hypothetical protein
MVTATLITNDVRSPNGEKKNINIKRVYPKRLITG